MPRQRAIQKIPTARPPDPESEGPASDGTARGADRKTNVPGGTSRKYQSLSRLVQSESAVVVYDGQQCIGTIIESDGQYDAFDAHGLCLGTFRKRPQSRIQILQRRPFTRGHQCRPRVQFSKWLNNDLARRRIPRSDIEANLHTPARLHVHRDHCAAQH
jgi:hypothetical protein